VTTRYGRKADGFVFPIAESFSTQEEEYHFAKLNRVSPRAHDYLRGIPKEQWRRTEWLVRQDLPPRYGILTSNTSESINGRIDEFRGENWVSLIASLLEHMIVRISTGRDKYKGKSPEEVVTKVRELVEENWNRAAAMDVHCVNEDGGEYMVRDVRRGATGLPRQGGDRIVQTLFPRKRYCSCGTYNTI